MTEGQGVAGDWWSVTVSSLQTCLRAECAPPGPSLLPKGHSDSSLCEWQTPRASPLKAHTSPSPVLLSAIKSEDITSPPPPLPGSCISSLIVSKLKQEGGVIYRLIQLGSSTSVSTPRELCGNTQQTGVHACLRQAQV